MGNRQLDARSPADGRTQWRVGWDEDEFDEWGCLQRDLGIGDDLVYVAGCDGLRGLSRADGEREWITSMSLRSGVAVGPDRVYANGRDLIAVDPGSGEVDWRAPTIGARLTRPAVGRGTVVHTDRVDGVVTAFDTDGAQVWQHHTGTETRSPTVADDTVYVATADDPGRTGELLALDRRDGNVRWRADTTGTVKRGTRPVVGDERVFLGCNGTDAGRMIAVDKRDGTERWTFTDGNTTVYEPALADDSVYAGSNDNRVYALGRDGRLRWEFETDRTVGSVVAGDDLVFASSGALFALVRE
ncbi:PQQ-binding-like beta-propeller repeat protein [Halobaculum litoreum]|uniref:outer membrane protein assembly factor BamB family protein n=1 Tax=Halobaculum litoreum TaxID=3031998 RepID=UPI0024C25145